MIYRLGLCAKMADHDEARTTTVAIVKAW